LVWQKTVDKTSIIALSKNAGKTTLLNYFINQYQQASVKLGISTIGVDGEEKDLLSGHAKPLLTVPEGTLVVTTAGGLSTGTASWRILEKTAISSSIGDVYLAEAVQSGTVKLLGTPHAEDISYIGHLFHSYGVEKMFVDGAYDRFSSADPSLVDHIYLVIGASLHPDEKIFWRIVEKKLFPFFYPIVREEEIIQKSNEWERREQLIIKHRDQWNRYPARELYTNQTLLNGHIEWMLLPGVLTEQLMYKMLHTKRAWHIVLPHGLKSFLTPEMVDKWRRKGGTIQVLHPISIKSIVYNPYSPEGYTLSSWQMEQRLQRMVKAWTTEQIPVINIWR